jgi:hypothetical protein
MTALKRRKLCTRTSPSRELTYGTRILLPARVKLLADSREGGRPRPITGFPEELIRICLESALTRPCFIHSQGPSHEILGIKLFNGFQSLFTFAHLHKPKAFGTSGGPIHDDLSLLDPTILFKQLSELVFIGLKRDVSNVDVDGFHFGTPFMQEKPLRVMLANFNTGT